MSVFTCSVRIQNLDLDLLGVCHHHYINIVLKHKNDRDQSPSLIKMAEKRGLASKDVTIKLTTPKKRIKTQWDQRFKPKYKECFPFIIQSDRDKYTARCVTRMCDFSIAHCVENDIGFI